MVEILLVGDVTPIVRNVNGKIYRYTKYEINKSIINLFQRADIVIGNLETTITYSNDYDKGKQIVYKMPPDETHILDHFTYLNIANNHILDYKKKGLTDTMEYLDKKKIYYTGAGITKHDLNKYVILERDGYRIGILSGADYPHEWACHNKKQNSGCINYMPFGEQTTLNKIKKYVDHMKKNNVNYIIFSYHYGPNYKLSVEPYRKFLQSIINLDIDLVHGHSAHHLNRIEKVGTNKYIIYSNGEFINDYGWENVYKMDESMIVKITLENNDVKLKMIPTRIHYTHTNNGDYYAGIKSAVVKLG